MIEQSALTDIEFDKTIEEIMENIILNTSAAK